MNRWTFFSTHGIVPRGLEDAGERKNNEPAKAAAIPCRSKEGGRMQGYRRQGLRAELVLFVPRGHRHWMTRRCNGRTARAATVCAAWMGWADGMDGLAAAAVASRLRHSNLNNRLTIETRKRGLPQPKTAHTHTESTPARGRVAQTTTNRQGFMCSICTEGAARFSGTSQHGVQPLTKCRCCGCGCLLSWYYWCVHFEGANRN